MPPGDPRLTAALHEPLRPVRSKTQIATDWAQTADTRLFAFTVLLGGFTTFSAFGMETVHLLRRAEYSVALAYVVLSVVCGVSVLWFAMSLISSTSAVPTHGAR
ncbi:hypothetical protein BH09PLA1_BH09PLA1_08580 [soil metagenome]